VGHAARSLFAIVIFCLIGAVLALPTRALADRRVALLIANAGYSSTAVLHNPHNDAALLARALQRAGFDSVETAADLTRSELVAALRAFEDKATGADIAVVYYSGHGMEMGGQNYLLPVDAKLSTDRDVVDEAITLKRVQLALDGVKRLRLVILDACRNNPFETSMTRVNSFKSVTRGLSRVEPGINTLVAFAAKAGTVAEDGKSDNSPYAIALANRLVEPGVDVQLAFREVRDDVLDATQHRQEPFVYGSLGGSELPLSKGNPQAILPAEQPDDDAVWEAVKNAGDAQLVRDFLLKYPRNRHREEAIALLSALLRPPSDTPVLPPAPAPVPTATKPPEPARQAALPPNDETASTRVEPVELQQVTRRPPKPAQILRRAKPVAKPTAKPAAKPAGTVRATTAQNVPRRSTPRKSSLFGCQLAVNPTTYSSYYGAGAQVLRCKN
jgi:caspase domain-containing protein